nr:hypothetical protein [Pseudoclavibacter sp. Marseille-Q3772]
MLEDRPEYILKTVYGKTDAEGRYSLRFGDYTDKNQTREDFLNPNHVFVWVENKDGVVQNGYTGFHTPVFQEYNDGGNFRALAIPEDAKNGDFFNVVLVSGGNDVSAWTVLVTKDSDEYTPANEDKVVVPGEETSRTRPSPRSTKRASRPTKRSRLLRVPRFRFLKTSLLLRAPSSLLVRV